MIMRFQAHLPPSHENEVADYFEAYARTFELPVRTAVKASEREHERLPSRAIQSSISVW